MYDNVDFKIRIEDVSGIDFLNEVPQYLDKITGEHDFNGDYVVTGILGNNMNTNHFKVTISRRGVNIKNGSLCKYYLGDNFKTLGRRDTQEAIGKLSDTLHLPIDSATVSSIDVAQNFIVKQPVQVYYNHFGELKYAGRSPVTNGEGEIETLYYYKSKGVLVFYDKIKEQQSKKQPIPELYQNRNVLRYEQRYKSRLPNVFHVERVTASMLYSEKFYIDLLNSWRDSYYAIKKINDITINIEAMKGKKDLYTLGVLSLIEKAGGELAMMTQIEEAQKSGKIDKKRAYDFRQVVKAACSEKVGISAQNECILELDRKVKEAVKFYR